MDFEAFLKKIEDERVHKFQNKLEPQMNRKIYVSTFLEHFLGHGYIDDTMNDENFEKYWTNIINNISLCEPEIIFFKEMTKSKYNTIEQYIKLYNEIKDLDRCQLGSEILRNLQLSEDIKIY